MATSIRLSVWVSGEINDGSYYQRWTLTVTIAVVPMISYIYFADVKGGISAVQGDEIKGSFAIGMILGQLIFGILGDTLGRHRVYGKECLFAIFGTLLVVLLPWRGLSQQGIVAWLTVFRIVSGMGAGGDYPMTCTLAAEHAVIGTRARLTMLAFSFMAVGQLAAAIVFIVLLAAFKTDIESDINRLEWVWRLLLGLGIVPACLTLYARLKMRETKPYEKCKFACPPARLLIASRKKYLLCPMDGLTESRCRCCYRDQS